MAEGEKFVEKKAQVCKTFFFDDIDGNVQRRQS